VVLKKSEVDIKNVNISCERKNGAMWQQTNSADFREYKAILSQNLQQPNSQISHSDTRISELFAQD